MLQQDTCAINDPHGQTHSPVSSHHYSHTKVLLFCKIFEKWGRTDGQQVWNCGRPRGSIKLVEQRWKKELFSGPLMCESVYSEKA